MVPTLQVGQDVTVSTLAAHQIEALRDLVRTHQAVYEIGRATRIVDGGRRDIGFDIALCGTHAIDAGRIGPGCPRCEDVWRGLKRVADAVRPPETRMSRYVISSFDHALHLSPARQLRYDVELVICVRHREGYLEPIDPCERECVQDIERDLAALELPNRQWRGSSG